MELKQQSVSRMEDMMPLIREALAAGRSFSFVHAFLIEEEIWGTELGSDLFPLALLFQERGQTAANTLP